VEEFMGEVCRCPTTPASWLRVAEQFGARWQFHHALGVLDGKHIRIQKLKNGGSTYFNYKKFYSIVLMALVDADYKFLWCDVGSHGSASDGQIWNDCQLRQAIEQNMIWFPPPLPGDNVPLPYFLIGDDAFSLKTWMMKPFSRMNMERPERIFNYRLSRARRVVENAFRILANRFRCMLGTMCQDLQNTVTIMMACICLHNLMQMRYPTAQNDVVDHEDPLHNVIPGRWRADPQLHDMEQRLRGNTNTLDARRQRIHLKDYYNSADGAVEWQDRMVT
jgi:hypothetical protein